MTGLGWALVTGAGRRLGRTLALAAAGAGYDLLLHTRNAVDGEDTARAVTALGRVAIIVAGDLADPAIGGKLIAAAPGPVTLLVNCASLFEDGCNELLSI